MKNILIFEGQKVEVLEVEGKALFNPYHVGECLDLTDGAVRKAMTGMSDKQVIKLTNSDVNSSNIRKLNNAGENFLTESGVYKLIFKSRKPSAEKFSDWVTDEVLPSIRKDGGYIASNENDTDEDIMARAILVAQRKIEEREKQNKQLKQQIAENAPKVLFADAVDTSQDSILVGQLAKLIRQNGVDIGQNRLFDWMRNNGYLIRQKGENYNLPTQYSLDLKLMEIKKRIINNPDGSSRTTTTPKITGKGQIYFVEKFLM